MTTPGLANVLYQFGGFRLDGRRRLLLSRVDGHTVALPAKVADTLLYMVERAGEVVEKSALLRAVWPQVRVEENSLSQCISALRRALGESPTENQYVATVPGRGYRFVAEVEIVVGNAPVPVESSLLAGIHTRRSSAARSLAVLPFKAITRSDSNESLELGMADALITRIGGLRNVVVSPLSSVRRFAAADQNAVTAARQLGVDCVLDGSVQRSGERIRVSVRLTDVVTGTQLWAEHFDQNFTDIFAIQDAIAQHTAGALVEELTSGDRHQLGRRPTNNARAYQLYVNGWLNLTRPSCDSLEKALRYLEQAVACDPDFALAYACLADCYAVFSVFGGGAPHDIFPKAIAAVSRALELDPGLPEAHAELAHIRLVYDLDFDAAEESCLRALEINPDSSMAHHYMGLLLIARGNLEAALTSIRRARALEPLALNFNANIAMIHYYARRYDEAVTQLEITLDMEAGFDHARSLLGRAYLRLGQHDRAIEEFRHRVSATVGSAADLPVAYACAGRTAEASSALRELLQESEHRYVSAYDIATVYAALGQADDAFHWLARAIDQRAMPVMFLGVDPAFDGLRADQHFAALLSRLGVGRV